MVNMVVLVGRIGKDLSLGTGGKTPYLRMSVATERSFKKGDGWSKETDWHTVVVFGRTAEYVAKAAGKGSMVFVEGYLKTSKYQERYKTEVMAERVVVIDARQASREPQENGQPAGPVSGGIDDDLPF